MISSRPDEVERRHTQERYNNPVEWFIFFFFRPLFFRDNDNGKNKTSRDDRFPVETGSAHRDGGFREDESMRRKDVRRRTTSVT